MAAESSATIDDLYEALENKGFKRTDSLRETYVGCFGTVTVTDHEILIDCDNVVRRFYRASGGLLLAVEYIYAL